MGIAAHRPVRQRECSLFIAQAQGGPCEIGNKAMLSGCFLGKYSSSPRLFANFAGQRRGPRQGLAPSLTKTAVLRSDIRGLDLGRQNFFQSRDRVSGLTFKDCLISLRFQRVGVIGTRAQRG